ncbi:MAG: Gfo/Idh/MocA family oxidoreductase [Acidobacteriota bacterium]
MEKRGIGRRDFFKTTAVGAAAVWTAESARGVAPSDQLGVGVIGLGRQGLFNMRKFMEFPEFRIRALCDVYEPHLAKGKEIADVDTHHDFREVLQRKDVDVVLISTPDHWHALQTIMACQAGKDVYVEKPTSVFVAEGRKMVEAARKYERVVQVGTQQRSGRHFRKAVDIIRSGDLGKITAIRCWNFGNSFPEGIGNPPDGDPPPGLDWDFWLGPAPWRPFNPNRFGVAPNRWSTFRYFWDYAGGMMTDWGVHLLDIVQWATGQAAPLTVTASGGKFGVRDNRETPDTLTAVYEYPGFICTYENRDCNAHGINEHGYGIEFYGSEGTLFIDRSGFKITPQVRRSGEDWIPRMYSMEFPNVNDNNHDHVADFLRCIRSRQRPVSDIEVGHRSTTTCLLANIAYRVGRKLRWDAASEQILDDSEAAAHLNREYRAPWKLEV